MISVSFTFSVNRIDGDHDHRQGLDGELGEPVLQQLLEVLDVARHPGHDHAGLLVGVEVEAEALQVGEHADAQVVHHARGEPAGDPRLATLGGRGDRDREQEEPADGEDHGDAVVARQHPVVDPVLDQRPARPDWRR